MATPQTDQRMTADEFWDRYAWPDDRVVGDRELRDGVVVEGEVPSYRHQKTLLWLTNALDPWVRAKGGRTWTNGGLRLAVHEVREPDLMAWWSQQSFDPDAMFTAVPDLVVEVVSPQPRDVRRDREEKLAEYCAFGIPHYWIVEPIHRVFEAYLRQRQLMTGGSRLLLWEYARYELATSGIVRPLVGPVLDLDVLWASVEQ